MREYRPQTVQELVVCTCDRCKRRLTPDEPGEWQERLSFDHSCGFDSVFGDCNTVSLDLCQRCVREVLGQWLRIAQPEEPHHPNLEKFAAFGTSFMADGRGEHGQDKRAKSTRRLTALKGIIRKPTKPVSVEDMNTATAQDAGQPIHSQPSGRRTPKKRP